MSKHCLEVSTLGVPRRDESLVQFDHYPGVRRIGTQRRLWRVIGANMFVLNDSGLEKHRETPERFGELSFIWPIIDRMSPEDHRQLGKTYVMAESPAPAMPWEEYEQRLREAWKELLKTASSDERAIHAFLEKHPCLLPADLFPASGHTPFRSAVFSKPKLSADATRIPDFMWIAYDSLTLYPVLIEIEAPGKRWFNSKGMPSQHFTAACAQLTQRKSWFNKPANQQVFSTLFMCLRICNGAITS